MTQPDNWGWQARIGLFIVGVESVPEAEWWAMVPPNVSLHAARVTAKTPWAGWNHDRSAFELSEDVVRGTKQFAGMRLSAVVIGHSSSSFLGGNGWDEAVVAALHSVLPRGIFATTNGLDCLAALKAIDVRRPFLVLPPWFNDNVVELGCQYFADRGIGLAGYLHYDPGRNWRGVPPGDMYSEGLGFKQAVEPLYAQIRAQCPREADGVLIAGTGFRCVAIINALERDLQRPVLTANKVSLWHCLRKSGVHTPVSGYGRLLNI